MRTFISFVFIIVLTLGIPSVAGSNENIIKKIVVQGATRTENSTIISYSELEAGQIYDKQKADDSLKRLYGTGFFSDAALSFHNGVVTIRVEENPIISGIRFSGNKALKSDSLLSEITLQKRGYFSKSRLREDVNRIMELYSKVGKFSVTVNPKILKLPQNRVDVLFEIQEGEKMKIEKISFVGNKKFSSNDLKQALLSKENRIFNILRTTHYNSDAIEYDKIALRRFYTSRGYADFRIISVNVEAMPPSIEKAYITFVIDEGARYSFGKISAQNNITSIKNEELLSLRALKTGEIFNSSAVEDLNTDIIKYLAEKGFPFVQVEYEYNLNKENKIVDVVYKISKGAKVYIGKININGNYKTYDYVIRREFRLAEGDPYNGFLVSRSEQRLRDLDYFEKLSVTPVKTDKPDIVDIDVKVTEKSTAQLKFAVGYSTGDGPLASINFTEINWLGKGQRVSGGIQKTVHTTGVSFGGSEPHFMGTEVEVGGSLSFSKEVNNTRGLGKLAEDRSDIPFNEESYTASVFMSYDLVEYLNYNLDYSINTAKTTRAGSINKFNAGLTALLDFGRYITSAVGHVFTYNKANSIIKPTDGYIITFGQTIAGVGGNVRHLRQVLKGAYYYPITEDLTLKLVGEGGHINRIGGTPVRIQNNFYLGDFSFRGFDYGGLGPRDKGRDGYTLGGLTYYKGTTELQFPFPGIQKDVDLTTSIFADFGSVWGLDVPNKIKSLYTRSNYYDNKSLRASVGIGFIWITQAGPLRIDFARAVKKEKFDQTREFLFSFASAM